MRRDTGRCGVDVGLMGHSGATWGEVGKKRGCGVDMWGAVGGVGVVGFMAVCGYGVRELWVRIYGASCSMGRCVPVSIGPVFPSIAP